MSSFPDDWIVPGEFTYGRSGEERTLTLGPVCRRRFWSGRKACWLRSGLARLRRRLGYPPLFWVRLGAKWPPDSPLDRPDAEELPSD